VTIRRPAYLALIVLLLPPAVRAQDENQSSPPAVHVFASGGLGGGTRDTASHLALSVNYGRNDFILRLAETSDFEFCLFSCTREQTSRDIALLYGRRYAASSEGWLRAAAGLGLAQVGETGTCALDIFLCGYTGTTSSSVGVAWQLDAVWTPWAALGVGAGAFGSFNSSDSFAGLALVLHLGRVR
jgi:hypothetical protein